VREERGEREVKSSGQRLVSSLVFLWWWWRN